MTEKEIYKNGVALLEEWEDVNYCEHNFKFKDEWLTDKEVVDLLSQLNDENEQLIMEKERYKTLHRIAHEQMDNRILTIQNFVDECSDDNVKKALEKLLCTEVLDYDVSAKNSALIDENEQLKSENKRLTDKLNETALEFLNHDMVTMGKATEISEMCYYDFLKYRKENGNPMELKE